MKMNVLVTCVGCAPAICIINSLKKSNDYNIIGIDITNICAGFHLVDKFYNIPKINDPHYYDDIIDICNNEKINYIFITNEIELSWWASNKKKIEDEVKVDVKIFSNSSRTEFLCGDKFMTADHCIKNEIQIPNTFKINEQLSPEMEIKYNFPIIAKPFDGAGSVGIQIIKNKELLFNYLERLTLEGKKTSDYVFQEFIKGIEYTVDVAVVNNKIVAVVPKQRLEIKNGQATKSKTIKDQSIIDFAKKVAEVFEISHTCNIQIIQSFDSSELYLIEVNAKFASSLALTVESGVNIPEILIKNESDNYYDFNECVTMVRCHKEFYFNS